MPISIAQAQSKFKDPGGESRDNFVVFDVSENILEQYGIEFMKNLGKFANQKNVVDTGKLLSDSYFKVTDGNTLQLWLPDYFDYPNEGVRGVKSSKNAPGSPYKFKNFGMSAEGRANIKGYIQRGRAKIETVKKNNDKALGIGREKKHISLIDAKTEQLIYLIKRFGIKKTGYFNKAIEETFKDFAQKMGEALGQDIIFSLEKLNKRGNNN
jgi:hypothetical protein